MSYLVERDEFKTDMVKLVPCACEDCPRHIAPGALFYPLCSTCVTQRTTGLCDSDPCCANLIQAFKDRGGTYD